LGIALLPAAQEPVVAPDKTKPAADSSPTQTLYLRRGASQIELGDTVAAKTTPEL